MTGSPNQDWSRYLNAGANVVDHNSIPASSTFVGPTVDMAGWPYAKLYLNNSDTAAYFSGHLQFTSYNGVFNVASDVFFGIGPAQGLQMSVPVLDRKVVLILDQASVAPTAGFDYAIYGSAVPLSKYDAKGNVPVLVNDTSAYLAGAVKTINFFNWYEGPVQVAAFSNNNTAAWVEFQYYDVGSAVWTDFAIAQILSWPNSNPRLIYCPPYACRAVINNQGAAQTIAMHVSPAATL